MSRAALMQTVRGVVVKVGTAVLTAAPSDDAGANHGDIDLAVMQDIATGCAALLAQGKSVTVVTSGAIGLGWRKLGYPSRPRRMDALQACAGAGQGVLIERWAQAFATHQRVVAQVLLTHADFADRKRFLNVRRALLELTARHAVPVINENDMVSFDEIAFGDNDALSSQVANVVGADLLVMLSTAPALMDGETRVPEVRPDDSRAESLVRTDTSGGGTGGMATKLKAARAAAERGTAAVIAAGKSPGMLGRILAGEDVGTLFWPATERLASRAHWIAHTLRPQGSLTLDEGATAALRKGRSLLPSGIQQVQGSFRQGDPVDLVGPDGQVFARGLATYAAVELLKIQGKQGSEIERILGYHLGDEAVHKDDLVLLR